MPMFKPGRWNADINVRDFIVRNYTPYDGDEAFLCPTAARTAELWDATKELLKKEHEAGGVLDVDVKTISTVSAHDAGYIQKELELIVGLQTDAPLKRAIMPFGGIRTVKNSLETHGYSMDAESAHVFKYRKTHNDGVFDVYTDEIRAARASGIITGLDRKSTRLNSSH